MGDSRSCQICLFFARLYLHKYVTSPVFPKIVRRTVYISRQLNSLTSGPGAVGLKSSPATLKGGGEAQGGLDGLLASVTQPQRERDEAARQWATVGRYYG